MVSKRKSIISVRDKANMNQISSMSYNVDIDLVSVYNEFDKDNSDGMAWLNWNTFHCNWRVHTYFSMRPYISMNIWKSWEWESPILGFLIHDSEMHELKSAYVHVI